MTYRTEPIETYTTDLGCHVVSQFQETQAGLLIEHVALVGPKELDDEPHEVEI